MSDFYKIQLRRYPADRGFTGGSRPLSNAARSGRAKNFYFTGEEPAKERFDTPDETVHFEISPTVSESRTAEYVDRAIPGPSGIIVYAKTGNRKFSIGARLISRTVEEADINYWYVNVLRSWFVPQSKDGKSGRPPIIRLNGYKQQFFNIPVVLSDMTVNYPEDVDYIETPLAMVPIIQSIDLSLIESHRVSIGLGGSKKVSDATFESTTEAETDKEFILAEFKLGILPGY